MSVFANGFDKFPWPGAGKAAAVATERASILKMRAIMNASPLEIFFIWPESKAGMSLLYFAFSPSIRFYSFDDLIAKVSYL
jgi:hypothetical protein